MEKKKKIGFFKRLKMSILELENYIDFTAENAAKSIFFMLKVVFLFALILATSSVIYIYSKYGTPANYLNCILPDFKIEDSALVIENEKEQNEEQKVVTSMMKQMQNTYNGLFTGQNISKQEIVNYANKEEKNIVIGTTSFIFIVEFLDLLILWLMTTLMTSLIGLIALKFSRIKMKYSKLFALSVYASTLSMILTVIYSILNNYFNIYIDVFEYLSMLISYIYITAVIYMIKSDLLKQQFELIKRAASQRRIEEENRYDEPKGKEEGKEEDKGKENKEKTKDEEKEENADEPDGSEI